MLSHETLENYYKTTYALAKQHSFNLDTINNWIPFEYEIYIALLNQELEKKKLESMQ